MIAAAQPGESSLRRPSRAGSGQGEIFLRRAIEAYFARWPFYLLLFVACLVIGYLGVRDVARLYTSTGSFFVESRALINEQSADDFEQARLAPSGFVAQDLGGLMSTDPFMTTVAESLGYEIGELPSQRNPIFRFLRRSTEVSVLSANLVQVAVTTDDPAAAQAQAAAIIDAYVQFQESAALAEGVVAEDFFDVESQSVSEELVRARGEVDRFVSRFQSLDDMTLANTVELDRLRSAEAVAEVRFRAAIEGVDQARLIQARAETESLQQFSFLNEPVLPQTHDAAGLDAFYWMLSFVIVGLATNVLPAVVSASRSSTVLIPEDLAADPRLPVIAVVPRVAPSRLSIDDGAGGASSLPSTPSTPDRNVPVGLEPDPSTRTDGDGTTV